MLQPPEWGELKLLSTECFWQKGILANYDLKVKKVYT
jgi:hypothetical protein